MISTLACSKLPRLKLETGVLRVPVVRMHARYAPFASDGSVMTCAIACGMTLFRTL